MVNLYWILWVGEDGSELAIMTQCNDDDDGDLLDRDDDC